MIAKNWWPRRRRNEKEGRKKERKIGGAVELVLGRAWERVRINFTKIRSSCGPGSKGSKKSKFSLLIPPLYVGSCFSCNSLGRPLTSHFNSSYYTIVEQPVKAASTTFAGSRNLRRLVPESRWRQNGRSHLVRVQVLAGVPVVVQMDSLQNKYN